MRKLIAVLTLLLLAGAGQAGDATLRAVLKLSLDGVAVSEPRLAFRPGEPADMILKGEDRSIRVSLFAGAAETDGRTDLRVQIFRTNAVGEWVLIGEPRIEAVLGEPFRVAVANDAGGGYALEGTITAVADAVPSAGG